MPHLPRSATALSDAANSSMKIHRVFGLARRSLLLAALSMLPSCLIDDPPPYVPPDRTPPRLDYHKASPRLDMLVTAAANDLLTFEIPVASEDEGEDLTAQFYLDEQFLEYLPIPASTMNDQSRKATFSFTVLDALLGCHRFKIRVAHAFNLPGGNVASKDPNDVAEAYWWVNIGLPPEQEGMLTTCPTVPGASR